MLGADSSAPLDEEIFELHSVDIMRSETSALPLELDVCAPLEVAQSASPFTNGLCRSSDAPCVSESPLVARLQGLTQGVEREAVQEAEARDQQLEAEAGGAEELASHASLEAEEGIGVTTAPNQPCYAQPLQIVCDNVSASHGACRSVSEDAMLGQCAPVMYQEQEVKQSSNPQVHRFHADQSADSAQSANVSPSGVTSDQFTSGERSKYKKGVAAPSLFALPATLVDEPTECDELAESEPDASVLMVQRVDATVETLRTARVQGLGDLRSDIAKCREGMPGLKADYEARLGMFSAALACRKREYPHLVDNFAKLPTRLSNRSLTD